MLKEPDPAFELPPEQRYMASIHGKVLQHSQTLRKGIAEGLAMLGNNAQAYSNCSPDKAVTTAILTIREIFTDADWILWGSLSSLLPTLVEAAPNEFLEAVEKTLRLKPCPFDQLFAQESKGIAGDNYLAGLLWALEGLAWDEEYLVQVCVVLGELANHDPGGQSSNRPFNSLATILLPWLPQTLASIEKRQVAVQTLGKEWPDVGWKLLLELLPNQRQTSSGSYKPTWRKTIPDGWGKGVSSQAYWQQVSLYAEIAVSGAGYDAVRLSELINQFDSLPKLAFEQLIDVLSSSAIIDLPEEQRLLIWDHLTRLTRKHRRYEDAKWALSDVALVRLENVAERLAPSSPFNLHQHLFSGNDFELYDEKGNWEEQQNRLNKRRETAVREVFQQDRIHGVIRFAGSVVSPNHVRQALVGVSDPLIESTLLPSFLDSEDRKHLAFVSGYVWNRHRNNGWEWFDGTDKSGWTTKQIGQCLALLPFSLEAWERAGQLLGKHQGEYLNRTGANAYEADKDLNTAIDRLIEYGRPQAALRCLSRIRHTKQPISVQQCVRALLAALSSSEPTSTIDKDEIVELIRFLQSEPSVVQEDMFRIEWAYLPLLNRYRGAAPKLLENRLASDPVFFCEMIRLVYRSNKEDKPQKELSKESKAIAANAWRLLHEWKIPPGTQEDGVFNADHFDKWLEQVKTISSESGHLEISLICIGTVLIHAPADPGGLWIHRAIVEALNDRDAEDMRTGYHSGIYNARGVHSVEPSGQPEKELAEHFRQKAEEVENAGYQRLAKTLRDLGSTYEREAERITAGDWE